MVRPPGGTLHAIAEKKIDLKCYPQIIVRPYLDEMQYGLGAADFCVGRAGATFLAELTACGLPGILIPYPYAAENHQEYNAKALVEQNAATMILDKELTGEKLSQNILDLYQNKDKRISMAENAKNMLINRIRKPVGIHPVQNYLHHSLLSPVRFRACLQHGDSGNHVLLYLIKLYPPPVLWASFVSRRFLSFLL